MSSIRETFAFALALGALTAIVVHCTDCTPAPKLPAYCTDEVLFTAALVRCVDKASTRDESRACRADVHARCGITMTTSSRSVAP